MLVENCLTAYLVYELTFCVERYNIFLSGRDEHSEHKYTMRNFPFKHIFLVYLYFPLLWIINASEEAE